MSRLDPKWLHWPQTQTLIAAFKPHPGSFRFVGGAVRDALLGREVVEVDAATTLLPAQTTEILEKAHIRVIPTGVAHGTVTAVVQGKSFEITTLRKDIATDGRHAEVSFTDDWKIDASRRDFTMNALYLSPEGELSDYFEGEADAKAGKVRFIGDAGARIGEDYLRSLRFFRFYAYYGKGQPDAAALAACAAQAAHVATLSGERVQQELLKLVQSHRASQSLSLMHTHGLLPYVLGFALSDTALFARLDTIARLDGIELDNSVPLAGFVLKAAIPEKDAFTKLVSRLRLSNAMERTVQLTLQGSHRIHPTLTLGEQKHMIRTLGGEDFSGALVLSWARSNEPIDMRHGYYQMLVLAAEWKPPLFPVSGNDLIARGVTPGKDMGALLEKMEEQWEQSDYRLSKDELLAQSA